MARKRVLLLLLAALAVAGASVAVAQASTHGRSARPRWRPRLRRRRARRDAGQARRRDLPGERLLRSLLRHVSERRQHRRPDVPRRARARRRWTVCRRRRAIRCRPNLRHSDQPADQQSQRGPAAAPGQQPDRPQRRRRRPAHLRPGPRLQRRAAGVRRRQDGPLRPERRHRRRHASARSARPARPRPGHGLLRRQHRHRAVELRPALLDERQLVRHHVRAVVARRDQPGLRRHRERRHEPHGQQPAGARPRPRPTATSRPTARAGSR